MFGQITILERMVSKVQRLRFTHEEGDLKLALHYCHCGRVVYVCCDKEVRFGTLILIYLTHLKDSL